MIAVKRTIDPEDFARTLRKALDQSGEINLVHAIRVEPSVIQGSPYDYVVVWLTDSPDAKQFIISDAEEAGEDGIVVGTHTYGTDNHHTEIVPSTAHALVWVLEQIRQHAVS